MKINIARIDVVINVNVTPSAVHEALGEIGLTNAFDGILKAAHKPVSEPFDGEEAPYEAPYQEKKGHGPEPEDDEEKSEVTHNDGFVDSPSEDDETVEAVRVDDVRCTDETVELEGKSRDVKIPRRLRNV